MRKAIGILTVASFLLAATPQNLFASQGGGGERERSTSFASVEFFLSQQYYTFLVLVAYVSIVQSIMVVNLEALAPPIKVRKKKKSWSSRSSSDIAEEDPLEDLPELRPLAVAYTFEQSILLAPPESGGFEENPIEKRPDASIRYIETDGKGNADIYLIPPAGYRFVVDADDAWKHFSGINDDFQANMDKAEHIGNVDYGWDEEETLHIIRTTFKF